MIPGPPGAQTRVLNPTTQVNRIPISTNKNPHGQKMIQRLNCLPITSEKTMRATLTLRYIVAPLAMVGLWGFANPAAHAADAPAAASAAACPATLQHTYLRLQDEKPQSLCQYAGKVVLVVNTASYCGFTGQYKGLEELYSRYKDRGLVVLGFPSNDFGQQEPGSAKEIADFCANTFGVKFPMFAKSHVTGKEANPLFA